MTILKPLLLLGLLAGPLTAQTADSTLVQKLAKAKAGGRRHRRAGEQGTAAQGGGIGYVRIAIHAGVDGHARAAGRRHREEESVLTTHPAIVPCCPPCSLLHT